jgi:chaperonin GroEL
VRAGFNVVVKALESPIRQIAENAGVEGSIVVGRVTDSKSHDFGVDAQSEKHVDMMEPGIIDLAKVVLRALQHASSVASLLITTDGHGRRASEEGRRDSRYAGWRHGRHGLLICFNPGLREEGPGAIRGPFYE